MRLNHLASFNGNLGDSWAHSATEVALSHRGIVFGERLEIRNGYFQETGWDSFWNRASHLRTVMIGAGAFLVPRDSIARVGERVPFWDASHIEARRTVLHSVGIQDLRPLTEDESLETREFVMRLLDSRRVFFGIRHDSHKLLQGIDDPLLHRIPDAAFGIRSRWEGQVVGGLPAEYVAINVAGDQEEYRNGQSSVDWMRAAIGFADSLDLPAVLMPHTTADFRPIAAVADVVNWKQRSRLSVAPMLPTHPGAEHSLQMLGVYFGSQAIVANRYHSVIAGLLSSQPMVVIENAENVRDFLDSLEQPLNATRIGNPHQLAKLELDDLDRLPSTKAQLIEFSRRLDCYYDDMATWLSA